MNFKSLLGGGSNGDSSTSFAAAKALFEAAKKPENRALATAAAKNPVIRNAAISAAQNPQTRQAMVSAASTYTANQNNAPSSSVLRPEPAPKPPSKDYGSSSASYGSSVPARPAPSFGAAKPVYPDLMSELKALNIGRDNEPAPSYSSTPSWSQPSYQPPAPQPAYHQPAPAPLQPTRLPQPAYHPAPPPPMPAYHQPAAAPPPMQRQDWTKFSDNAPARPPPPKNMPLSPKSTSPTSEAYAVVKFPHTGSHFDEVTCIAGDRIVLKREVDDQWIYGLNQRTGKFGIVPIAFLDVKVPLAPSPTVHKKNTSAGPVSPAAHHAPPSAAPMSPSTHMATAVYDYVSQEPGDLSFNTGAHIKIIERVGTDWLSGELHGRSGIFPASFVDCPTLSRVPLRAAAVAAVAAPAAVFARHTTVSSSGGYSGSYGNPEMVTATYDYNSGVEGDLVFFTGDVIEVLERMPEGEWLRGRSRGQTGLVPLTYVSDAPTTMTSSTSNHSVSSSGGGGGAQSRFPAGTPLNPPITVTATADYHTGENDCLYFSRGDQILVTEYVDNEWAKGKLAEFKTLPAGYFPRGYVQ